MKSASGKFGNKRSAGPASIKRIAPPSAARWVVDALLRQPELYASVRDDLLAWKDDLQDAGGLALAEDPASAALADLVGRAEQKDVDDSNVFVFNNISIAAYAQENEVISRYLGELLRPEAQAVEEPEALQAACRALRRVQLQAKAQRLANAGNIDMLRLVHQRLAALG